jgi:hypothetical protein
MFDQRKEIFDIRVTGPDGGIKDFWTEVNTTDPKWLAWSSLLNLRPMFQSYCIPYALHGDAVPVFKGKSLYVLSACFVLGSGSSIDVKMLMTCYWSHMKKTKALMTWTATQKIRCGRYAQWDMETLLSGTHPVLDATGQPWPVGSVESKAQGKPLAGGFFFVPWIIKGDLEYYANVLGLEHWGRALHPCMFCKVDRGDWPWTDHRLLGHPNLQWTEAEWRANHPNVHRLFSILAMGLWSIQLDIMHTVSLGVAQHIAGNILYEIIYVVLARGSVKSRVQDLWLAILEGYRLISATTRLGGLTLSMFTDPSRPHQVFPLLKAKAKETEWLCRALAFVWPQFNDEDNPCHKHMSRVLALLLEFYAIAARGGIFHPPEDRERVLTIALNMLAHYNWLSKWAETTGAKRWNTVLKHHYTGHLAQQAQWLHMRAGATYVDEDYMGSVKHVASKVVGA